MKLSRKANLAMLLAFLVVGFVFLLPFLWMTFSSIKPEALIRGKPEELFPTSVTMGNYVSLFSQIPFFRFLINSFIFAGGVTLSSLLLDAMAGYAFAKLPFKGSSVLFILVLVTMMVPFQITMIPLYLIMNKFQILNTYAGLMLPRLTNAFGIYFMRQSFLSIPNELMDAGRIDGVGETGIFFRIMVPVVVASLSTLGVFHFMYNWNDFLWPMLMTNTVEMQTLPVGLALFQGEHVMEHGPMFAGAVLSIVPILVIFLAAQKTFIKGIALSGIKG
ncbi:L-arabinose transport system permease protein AraQ [bioreactor metagenome]|uniref:L-arabinose transport system permease protein AraQ n=1 Tax=bioreactor metagenome TaxID=1076179 RepID=A0A644ZHJ0_9ZZZZ|nr:carbohydrate ABC transporter permease [Sphaerochaeta sp.]